MTDILGDRDPNVPETPTRVAEPSRVSQLPKRFYKEVTVLDTEDGCFQIGLDERPVKTPGRNDLVLKSKVLAENVAAEWDAQEERIDPMAMPLTRLINTAIDGVATDPQAVKEDIVRFAGTDMLCYRAGTPDDLVKRQTELWDPWIDWAQSSTHVVTSLTGSATLAMAAQKGAAGADEIWALAHLDEDWNIEQWGTDEEAAARRSKRFEEMSAACQVLQELR